MLVAALRKAMLGRGVIVGEGITEKDAILATAEKMEEFRPRRVLPARPLGCNCH